MPNLWWQLATIISCGTLAAVLIPEFTKVFTSSHSKHVHEIVTASREGGASLTILSGLVAGNFSAFWMGMLIAGLMAGAFFVSLQGLDDADAWCNSCTGQPLVGVGSIFAFGLVAFGFLCMGPVNIAVDSYGPVTDNAQSVFELAQTEHIPGIKEEIKRDFGFDPDFERGKHYLEANDSAGNTFKATAKPVLIGTAVVGATTMIFSIILLLGKAGLLHLSLTDAPVLLGFICGGAVIFWFCGASMQAVTTGAYRAVEFIKKNMDLDQDGGRHRGLEDGRPHLHGVRPERHVEHLHRPDVDHAGLRLLRPELLRRLPDLDRRVRPVPGDLHGQRRRRVGQRQEVVEVDLKEKGTPLHAATVVGDTVGDPFKDTTSVALNPIIKFSTLFGLLAVEIAVEMKEAAHDDGTPDYTPYVGVVMLAIALVFVWRSFYAMRIPGRRQSPSRPTRQSARTLTARISRRTSSAPAHCSRAAGDSALPVGSGMAYIRAAGDRHHDTVEAARPMHAMPLMLGVLAAWRSPIATTARFWRPRSPRSTTRASRRPTRSTTARTTTRRNKWVLFGHHFAAISGRRAADRAGAGDPVRLLAGPDLAGGRRLPGRRGAGHAGAGRLGAPRRPVAGRDRPRRDRPAGRRHGVGRDPVHRHHRAGRAWASSSSRRWAARRSSWPRARRFICPAERDAKLWTDADARPCHAARRHADHVSPTAADWSRSESFTHRPAACRHAAGDDIAACGPTPSALITCPRA